MLSFMGKARNINGISAKTEKEEFAEFIRNFQMTVNI